MTVCKFDIPESLLSRIDLAKPDYLDRKGFVCLLIEKGLTGSDTLGPVKQSEKAGPSSSSTSTSKEEHIKPKNKVHATAPSPKFVFSVPEDLEFCKADLLEFWKEHKSGKKSRRAATVLIGGLRKIRDAYGEKAVNEQLDLACAYGWENITLANYEKFGLKQAKAAAKEPEHRHPASKVFTAADFETPVTNPILKELTF